MIERKKSKKGDLFVFTCRVNVIFIRFVLFIWIDYKEWGYEVVFFRVMFWGRIGNCMCNEIV